MKTKLFFPVAALLVASLACEQPFSTTTPVDDVSAALTQTAIAGVIYTNLTQTAQATPNPNITPTPTPQWSETATLLFATSTPALVNPSETATVTPSQTATPSATVTITPLPSITSGLVMISVTRSTNCRAGPGKVYDYLGALLVGETTEVVGRDATRNYWYVRNPDRKNGFCWLWGEYATVTGDISRLPVLTPPPTPTPVPDFEVEYSGPDYCTGWYFKFLLENTGGVAFRSYSILIRDTVSDTRVRKQGNVFETSKGCDVTSQMSTLAPGKRVRISSGQFIYNPMRRRLEVTVRLCTADNLRGACVTKKLTIRYEPRD